MPEQTKAAPARVGHAANKILEYMHVGGSYLVLGIMLWISADVASRVLLGDPLPDSREIVAYVLPILVFVQIPYVLLRGNHLRSPIITSRVPSRARRALAVFSHLLGATFFASVAYGNLPHVLRAYENGLTFGQGVMDLPVWFARGTVMVGSALMVLVFIVRGVASVRGRDITDDDESVVA